jgi:HSP20 family protein
MSFFNTLLPSLNGGCAEAETHVTRRPRYDITETAEGYDVAVNLPGVAKDGLEITDESGELRITGKPAFTLPEGRTVLSRETSEAAFELVLAHGDTIVPEKTQADLQDGVLRVKLSKVESAKPRKIAVS